MNKCDYDNKKIPDKVGASTNCQALRASALPMDCHRSYCLPGVNTPPASLDRIIKSHTLAAYNFTWPFCVFTLTTLLWRFAALVAGRPSSKSCSHFRSLTWNF